MAQIVTSPNMNLPVPVPSECGGPLWAQQIYACLYANIDQHNHSAGQGVPVQPSGINISSDLSFNNHSATSLQTSTYQDQGSALASSVVGAVYIAGGNLYYNAGNDGFAVQITNGHSVNGSSGTISGLPSGTASASYSAGTFVFQSATSTAANVDAASVLIRKITASSPAITISAPNALSGNYSFVLPPALPATQNFIALDASGNVTAYAPVSGGLVGSNFASNVNLPGNTVQENGLNVVVCNTNASTSSLAVIRGIVSAATGSVVRGEGFSASLAGTGFVNISYTTAFADIPIVVSGNADPTASVAITGYVNSNTTGCQVYITTTAGAGVGRLISFIIMGQRA